MLSMEEVYREHSRTVYRYLLSLTHDADLAQELTQETFYQSVRSVERFDGSCRVSTWLCAIAKNLLAGARRRRSATDELDEALAAPAATEQEVLDRLSQVELLRQLHLLDGEMREVMYLRLLGGLGFGQIGEILGHSENWARVTYYRGKEKLKKELISNG